MAEMVDGQVDTPTPPPSPSPLPHHAEPPHIEKNINKHINQQHQNQQHQYMNQQHQSKSSNT
jgi:hypothetical protein